MVIINQTLAKKYCPDEDPIGKRYGDTSLSADSMKEIVGIVDDIREGPLDSEIWPAEYVPFEQDPDNFFTVVARTSQTEASVLPAMNAAIRAIDPDLGTRRDAVMRDRIQDSPAAYLQRSSAWLVGGFAALALLLGIVGLYGVVAYSVSQRTREIGLRLAMGAERRSVYELILGEAGRLITLGLLLGVVVLDRRGEADAHAALRHDAVGRHDAGWRWRPCSPSRQCWPATFRPGVRRR